jgi:hypothetical protein
MNSSATLPYLWACSPAVSLLSLDILVQEPSLALPVLKFHINSVQSHTTYNVTEPTLPMCVGFTPCVPELFCL